MFEFKTQIGVTCKAAAFIFAVGVISALPVPAQSSPGEQIRVGPLPIRRVDEVPRDASAEELEERGDQLRAEKALFDALDYYRAAVAKKPSAGLYNKIGIAELLSQRLRDAENDFRQAINLDRRHADAHNNFGVAEYIRRRYGKAINQYEKAIALQPNTASYFSNLGMAYFSKKEWGKSIAAYSRAVSLDPDVFRATSNVGVSGQISSPEDRARFAYFLAKLYAKQGLADRSLEYLRRAMEEGYKGIDGVYRDVEFAQLRKDPRFVQLMSAPPFSLPE
jgi:tetratricopeptide (TPR) repeat protein